MATTKRKVLLKVYLFMMNILLFVNVYSDYPAR